MQETRLFDPQRGETRSMRSKEEAHDYRYFPEPDLPPVRVPAAWVEEVRADAARAAAGPRRPLPARAGALRLRRRRCSPPTAAMAEFFDAALAARGGGAEAAKRIANLLNGEVARLANETGLAPARLEAHAGGAGRGGPALRRRASSAARACGR